MCYGCWEKHGKPSIVNEKTKNAARLVDRVYEFHLAGGACHIVIDDFNIEDHHIESCYGYIGDKEDEFTSPEQQQAERECLDALKAMTIEERASALAIHDGFVTVDRDEGAPPVDGVTPEIQP